QHHSARRLERRGEKRDGRGWQNTRDERVRAGGEDAGNERLLEKRPGHAGVPCDEESGPPPCRFEALAEIAGRDATQAARLLRGQGRHVRDPANAVGPEEPTHGAYRASRIARTSLGVTRTIRTPEGAETLSVSIRATKRPGRALLRLTSALKSSSWRRRRRLWRPSTRTTTDSTPTEVTSIPGGRSTKSSGTVNTASVRSSVTTKAHRPAAKRTDI